MKQLVILIAAMVMSTLAIQANSVQPAASEVVVAMETGAPISGDTNDTNNTKGVVLEKI